MSKGQHDLPHFRVAFRSAVPLVFAVAIALSRPAGAGQYGTPAEARDLAERAARLIVEVGVEAARPDLVNPTGPFVDRDLYIFVLDRAGIIHSHSDLRAIGSYALGTRDPNGKLFVREILERGRVASEGFWVEYDWLHPRLGTFATKQAWIVPAGEFLVGCGAYPGEAT